MSDDIFTKFDKAEEQYQLGITEAWADFLRSEERDGVVVSWVGDNIWCANQCIMLHDDGVDDTQEL